MEKGEVKYYNNRPVFIIRNEGEGFYFVCASINLTHDVTGSCFCTPCNIGGTSTHKCADADEIIDAIMDEISDHEVFWVHEKYLMNQPFERKQYDVLVLEIEKLLNEKQTLIEGLRVLRDEITEVSNNVSLESRNLSDIQQRILFSQNNAIKYEGETKSIIPEIVNIGSISFNSSSFLALIKDSLILNKLKIGGVDNWEWYGESIGSDDFDQLAIDYLISLK
jgi:hypothetical protein